MHKLATRCRIRSKFRLNHFSRNVLAYSYADVNEFVAKPHGRLLKGPEGHALYKKTTDEVLEISATLDDTKKVRNNLIMLFVRKI